MAEGGAVRDVGAAALAERERRFADFAERHRERAVRVAWRLVGGDRAAAEDVTQDALVRAYRALPRFREEASLDTWFYRILVRQAHNYRRWRGVRRLWSGGDSESAPELPDPRPQAEGDVALRRRIAEALGGLTARQREVFVLVHLEGYRVSEASELLRKPTGTLKSHLHRALVALRRELGDLYEGAEREKTG